MRTGLIFQKKEKMQTDAVSKKIKRKYNLKKEQKNLPHNHLCCSINQLFNPCFIVNIVLKLGPAHEHQPSPPPFSSSSFKGHE